jgi:cytohesin
MLYEKILKSNPTVRTNSSLLLNSNFNFRDSMTLSSSTHNRTSSVPIFKNSNQYNYQNEEGNLSNDTKLNLTQKNITRQSFLIQSSTSTFYSYSSKKLFHPNKIAFGKIVPEIDQIKRKLTNKDENIKFKNKSCTGINKQIINMFKKGITSRELDKINELSKKNHPNIIGPITYPIIAPKKIVKNILPKEYNFKQSKTPDEVLRNAYYPVVRYQKKILNKHINAINKEIGVSYSSWFNLIKKENFSEKLQTTQDLIELQKDKRLIEMIQKLINANFKLKKEVSKVIHENREKEEYERKQKILSKFKVVLIKAAIHFKRLHISINDFYKMEIKSIKPFSNEGTFRLICAIKDKDVNVINYILDHDSFLVYDFDNFKQTPLHWAAKRNVYEVISKMLYKGANINALDEAGRTPLHVSVENESFESTQILLYEVADPLIKDNRGFLPKDLTNDNDYKYMLQRAEIVSFLIFFYFFFLVT